MRTRVKICGITRPEDAETAARCGADAIGLVFHPRSPRYVDAARAREIVAALPPFVAAVGLFLDARRETIEAVLAEVPLILLQFHGDECPADCGTFGLPYIKAVGLAGGTDAAAYAAAYPDAAAFLLDSHAPGAAGGTGRTMDWSALRGLALPRPWLLAGGLNPDNVAEAIATVRPWGIDLSSGVESAPGIKDAALIERLMNEVRRVDCQP